VARLLRKGKKEKKKNSSHKEKNVVVIREKNGHLHLSAKKRGPRSSSQKRREKIAPERMTPESWGADLNIRVEREKKGTNLSEWRKRRIAPTILKTGEERGLQPALSLGSARKVARSFLLAERNLKGCVDLLLQKEKRRGATRESAFRKKKKLPH